MTIASPQGKRPSTARHYALSASRRGRAGAPGARDEGTATRDAEPADTADLSPAERAELRRQGAKAAARGELAADNPMDRRPNSPEATGESTAKWTKRSKAWQEGHDAQSDVLRPGKPRGRRDNDER